MPKFMLGDRVRKIKGASWNGRVCGVYSTSLTAEGYCVESIREPGSVQIYPAEALEPVFCDCERSHNGLGFGGRVCDCSAP